jgi:predicted dehydrogenase
MVEITDGLGDRNADCVGFVVSRQNQRDVGLQASYSISMRVAIIGCGAMGRKRAAALAGCKLTLCCDSIAERARELAESHPGVEAVTDWQAVTVRPDIDIVLIATTHDRLAEIACHAAGAGKHILIEKPGARRASELEPVANASRRTGALVRIGFNHRYHRAARKARELFDSGVLGDLMFLRGRYGHGGRPGYECEWRAQPERSGGGELIDQGIHLIDLARWFLGDFVNIHGAARTYFWNMPVEDNAFLLLETEYRQIAFLHASWTEWKNLFSLEIYGRRGKLEISGLGGSYGVEKLTWHQMTAAMGPPETTSWEYPSPDDSWNVEFAEFVEDIRLHRQPRPGLEDAQAALRIIESVYEENQR